MIIILIVIGVIAALNLYFYLEKLFGDSIMFVVIRNVLFTLITFYIMFYGVIMGYIEHILS